MANISIPKQYQSLISLRNELPLTTSVAVADKFNKRHDNVLRDIESLECSENFKRSNFFESEYIDSQNRTQKSYNMTHDGFLILAMGFTGKEAMLWKETFIEAFNWMRNELIIQYKNDVHWSAMCYAHRKLENKPKEDLLIAEMHEKQEAAAISLLFYAKPHMENCTCKEGKQTREQWKKLIGDRDVSAIFNKRYTNTLEEILKIMDELEAERNARP